MPKCSEIEAVVAEEEAVGGVGPLLAVVTLAAVASVRLACKRLNSARRRAIASSAAVLKRPVREDVEEIPTGGPPLDAGRGVAPPLCFLAAGGRLMGDMKFASGLFILRIKSCCCCCCCSSSQRWHC
jgi:hypothetical protein